MIGKKTILYYIHMKLGTLTRMLKEEPLEVYCIGGNNLQGVRIDHVCRMLPKTVVIKTLKLFCLYMYFKQKNSMIHIIDMEEYSESVYKDI